MNKITKQTKDLLEKFKKDDISVKLINNDLIFKRKIYRISEEDETWLDIIANFKTKKEALSAFDSFDSNIAEINYSTDLLLEHVDQEYKIDLNNFIKKAKDIDPYFLSLKNQSDIEIDDFNFQFEDIKFDLILKKRIIRGVDLSALERRNLLKSLSLKLGIKLDIDFDFDYQSYDFFYFQDTKFKEKIKKGSKALGIRLITNDCYKKINCGYADYISIDLEFEISRNNIKKEYLQYFYRNSDIDEYINNRIIKVLDSTIKENIK